MRSFAPPVTTRFYAGVDLHARNLFLVVLDRDGQTCFARNLPANPDSFLHAVAPFRDGLLVACAGKLVLLDRSTGKVTATIPTGARVDEMTYDPGPHVAYCASRTGNISVVSVGAGKLSGLGEVPDETGTGDITVDPKTHTVWIAYKKGGECFVQPFTPAK